MSSVAQYIDIRNHITFSNSVAKIIIKITFYVLLCKTEVCKNEIEIPYNIRVKLKNEGDMSSVAQYIDIRNHITFSNSVAKIIIKITFYVLLCKTEICKNGIEIPYNIRVK